VYNAYTAAGQKTKSYFNNYIRANKKALKKAEEADRPMRRETHQQRKWRIILYNTGPGGF